MNQVQLCGRIQRIKEFDTVAYATVHCRDGRNSEFIDVTIFNPSRFFSRYFAAGAWVTVIGHVHINTVQNKETGEKRYKTEIIAERIGFAGDAPMETDPNGMEAAQNGNQTATNSEKTDPFANTGFNDLDDDPNLPF